jgi:hypothetical protein
MKKTTSNPPHRLFFISSLSLSLPNDKVPAAENMVLFDSVLPHWQSSFFSLIEDVAIVLSKSGVQKRDKDAIKNNIIVSHTWSSIGQN